MSVYVFKTNKGYVQGDLLQGVNFVDDPHKARKFEEIDMLLYEDSIWHDLVEFYNIQEMNVERINLYVY